MSRYFIELAYKGTNYSGFQIQENALTIQSEVEKAFQILHRSPVQLTGSSRTDTGVHALQNFFHFDFDGAVHPQAVYKLNGILPKDIVIRNIHEMLPNAHSRFDAISREYNYRIHRFKDPFLEHTSFYYPYKVNVELLNEGAELIMNQENFFAFSKTNTQVKNFRCTIYRSEWIEESEQLIYIIKGNRFLRGMVRLLTATLLKVGRGKLTIQQLENFFSTDRRAMYSLPAHGLFLQKVEYPVDYFSSFFSHDFRGRGLD
jgi:tRNA pseudouridine38-40 synthase